MSKRHTRLIAAFLGSSALATSAISEEFPRDGAIVLGSGSISTEGATMTVRQESDRLVTHWSGFSIGSGNAVVFQQPSASSVALNRVTGVNPSAINGSLSANGQVFLINPNGIVFGAGAQVNTAALVASTLDIADRDFLRGRYDFSGSGGAIVNNGGLNANVVALIAPSVTNAGVISGDTALAAGTKVALDFAGDGLISVNVEESTLATLVDNRGAIKAPGGKVFFTAKGASGAKASVINNSGTVEAKGMVNRKGRILLLGDMENGTVDVSGRLDASAPERGDGGFIETSAKKVKIAESAKITSRSETGTSGQFLIDPPDYTIAASGGDITGATLGALLASNGTVTIQSASGASGTDGNIYVNDGIGWGSGSTLTLEADNNIIVNGRLNVSGTGGLVFNYGQGQSASGNTSAYIVRGEVNLAPTSSFETKQGVDGVAANYTVITSAAGLQAIGDAGNLGNPGRRYVLGSDIDLSSITNFAPIVNVSGRFQPEGRNVFSGVFDGLGHRVSNLTINRPADEDVGLFGFLGGNSMIRNFTLVGGSVTGGYTVGAAAGMVVAAGFGRARASIENVGAEGVSVIAINDTAGGLVGRNQGFVGGSYATGNVASNGASGFNATAGGLVGINQGTIVNSYASGSVSGVTDAGGLVGLQMAGSVSNAYATGAVSAGNTGNAGGLIGKVSAGTVSTSYFLDTRPNNGNGTPIGDTQLTNPATFSGWDMATGGGGNSVWRTYTGQTAPLLSSFLTPVTVTASSATSAYSGMVPSPGVTYSTYGGGAVDTSQLAGTTSFAGANANVGYYTVTPSGLYSSQSGYDISYGPGSLTVTPAALTVTTGNDSRTYGGAPYSGGNGVTFAGLVNGEGASVLTGVLSYGGTAQGAVDPGAYTISASGLASPNYAINWVGGILSILPPTQPAPAKPTPTQTTPTASPAPASLVSQPPVRSPVRALPVSSLWPKNAPSSLSVTDPRALPLAVSFVGETVRQPLLHPLPDGRMLLVNTRSDVDGFEVVTLPRTTVPTQELLGNLENAVLSGKTGRLARFTRDARGCGCLMPGGEN